MTKEARIYNRIKIVYSINGVGRIGQIHAKNEMKPLSYTTHKNKLKWIKDIKVRLKTIIILEENIDNKILDVSHSSIFF